MSSLGNANAHTIQGAINYENYVLTALSNDSDRFIDTYFTSNSLEDQGDSNIGIIENEIDDDETKSQKNKISKRHVSVSCFNYRDATIVLSEINNDLSPYSYFGESYECWYILYQVFQI